MAMSAGTAGQRTGISLFAAGSLRAAMSEIIQAFAAAEGAAVIATYGPSGILRERIEKGERTDVFLSADVGNPQTLARAGRASSPIVFARNSLCALVAGGVDVDTDTLLERMLDARVKLGTSTPKADPSGDYAWQLFEKADALRPGAYKRLDAKALKLTGGPDSSPPSANRSAYGVIIAERKADIFLTYCTNALRAVLEVAGARSVAVPEALAVGADYGLATINGASMQAERFARFVMSRQAQSILARHGFAPGATR